MENPIDQIASFLEECNTFKMNEVSNNIIPLWLFPFSLKDKVNSWLLNSNTKLFPLWIGSIGHSYMNTFLLGRQPKLGMTSLPSLNGKVSPYMKHGSALKTF